MKIIVLFTLTFLNLFAYSLSIQGDIKEPYSLDEKEFNLLTHTTLKDVSVVCASGEEKQKPKDLNGVLLMDLVQKAKVAIKSKKKLNQIIVLAKATDDYAVAFSYNEIFNTDIGNSIIVVYENNSFSLYSKKDFLTGPRHVYSLDEIQIKLIE
ncbi:hypothetical protein [Halarcobacter ebronensis]|uniref:Oxidoreductase molybdopterin-binding domain-containing protein n=1 Tax=Halarcobacter ebronensis TaxID=1462615 RepID=A0A4Q1APN0_9BACT|nr:hypothetical protein [Halarcobacter ebronensis]QKF82770.1 hypothetical protein AEBR_2302 [Halarcobacter ebronensis]RXK06795.1 hypothetical protein CRV07_05020 [Halarcobacter ebronensis]